MQIDFSERPCPDVFESDPYAAWAFWKFRHDAYTQSSPHDGYRLLAAMGGRMPKEVFSITSNIDGHWVRIEGIGEERMRCTAPSPTCSAWMPPVPSGQLTPPSLPGCLWHRGISLRVRRSRCCRVTAGYRPHQQS
eukprot:4064898-Prymnesium_polylepis.1